MSKRERDIRARALAVFLAWTGRASLVDVGEVVDVATQVVLYGQELYDKGEPLYLFRSTILAIQDMLPELLQSHQLKRCRRAVTAWQSVEPSCPHVPLPLRAWEAMLSLSLLLDQPRTALVLAVGFACMLRPGEALALCRADVSLPADRLEIGGCAFVAVWQHKTRVRGAGAQHVKLVDPTLVNWLDRMFVWLELKPEDRLFPFSPQQFRRTWDFLLRTLQLPSADGIGFTPASLRAGGATAAYPVVGLQEVRWCLRHTSESSFARYIQEAGAACRQPFLGRESTPRPVVRGRRGDDLAQHAVAVRAAAAGALPVLELREGSFFRAVGVNRCSRATAAAADRKFVGLAGSTRQRRVLSPASTAVLGQRRRRVSARRARRCALCARNAGEVRRGAISRPLFPVPKF